MRDPESLILWIESLTVKNKDGTLSKLKLTDAQKRYIHAHWEERGWFLRRPPSTIQLEAGE